MQEINAHNFNKEVRNRQHAKAAQNIKHTNCRSFYTPHSHAHEQPNRNITLRLQLVKAEHIASVWQTAFWFVAAIALVEFVTILSLAHNA